jgi:hypothetical protein
MGEAQEHHAGGIGIDCRYCHTRNCGPTLPCWSRCARVTAPGSRWRGRGTGLVTWITICAGKGRYTEGYHNPVENVGLYWHFVDLVWIYLFPLLYLISRMHT